MPKTFSIGGSGIGKVENVVVATHEVDHPRGDRQVDVWLILWIAIKLEDAALPERARRAFRALQGIDGQPHQSVRETSAGLVDGPARREPRP